MHCMHHLLDCHSRTLKEGWAGGNAIDKSVVETQGLSCRPSLTGGVRADGAVVVLGPA